MAVGRPFKGNQKRGRVSFTLHPADITWLETQAKNSEIAKSEALSKILHFYQKHGHEISEQEKRNPNLENNIHIPWIQLQDICQRFHVERLAIFGSALTNQFSFDSDLDLIVFFERNQKTSLFDLSKLQEELTQIFGRNVDLRTIDEISSKFRKNVLRESINIYEQ